MAGVSADCSSPAPLDCTLVSMLRKYLAVVDVRLTGVVVLSASGVSLILSIVLVVAAGLVGGLDVAVGCGRVLLPRFDVSGFGFADDVDDLVLR